MKYLLIKNPSYEKDDIYSFESDKSLAELKAEFSLVCQAAAENSTVEFCGRRIYNNDDNDIEDYELFTLDGFWNKWNHD